MINDSEFQVIWKISLKNLHLNDKAEVLSTLIKESMPFYLALDSSLSSKRAECMKSMEVQGGYRR